MLGLVLSFLSFFVGQAVLSGAAPTATLDDPGVLRALLESAAFLALLALFGVGIGAIIRHSAGAIATFVGCTLLLPLLLHNVAGNPSRFMPVLLLGNSVAAVVPISGALSSTAALLADGPLRGGRAGRRRGAAGPAGRLMVEQAEDTGVHVRVRGRELSLAVSEEQAASAKRSLAQRILREPFTKRPWAELAFFVVSGGLAGIGLAFVGVTMVTGVVLAITFFGLAVLALSIRSARGIGGWQRGLARAMLGESVEDPEPFAGRRGFLGWLQSSLRDRVGWRAVAYLAVKVPWTILGFFVAVQPVVGRLRLPHPIRSSVRGGGGLPVFGLARNLFPGLSSPTTAVGFLHSVGVFVLGAIFFFAAPWVMRGFVNVDRMLIRAPARTRSHGDPGPHARAGPDPDGRRLGGHAAPHRARPARRHPGAAGGAGHAAGHGQGEARGRPRRTSTSTGCASSSTRRTGAPRRPSPSCATSPAASTRRRSTSAWRAPWPRWPPAARCPPSSRSTCRRGRRPAIEAIAYFCVAELLANVAQHAQASRASVSCAQQGTWLRLVVRDDGRGGAQLTTVGSSSSGLAGLTDRVHAVDGRLNLVSPPGGPTVVTVDLPLGA